METNFITKYYIYFYKINKNSISIYEFLGEDLEHEDLGQSFKAEKYQS